MRILIKNADVITMNPNNDFLKESNIAIENENIVAIGDIPNDFNPDKIIDAENMIAMPGLINAHTHAAMSLLRNYSDDLPLWQWLNDKIWPIEAKLTEEDVYWGSMLSAVEMIKGGVTCFQDMYFFMEETAKAVDASGIRACLGRGLTGPDENDEVRFRETRELYDNWNNIDNGRITVMVAPHAPYTCSKDYLKKVIELAKELEVGIHIHLSESRKEVEDCCKEHGKSPIELMEEIGLFTVPTTAAHCVHLSEKDIKILKDDNVSIVYNPGSNLKLGNGFAPIKELVDAGVNIALGTDGASSNNNLNMFEEINLAALVNKAANEDTTCIPAMKALEMATINGAKAMNREKELGSLEIGKKADIILIDTNKPHMYPKYNMISSLVYSAQASDVDTVIINGNIIMRNRILTTVNESKIFENIEKSIYRIMKK